MPPAIVADRLPPQTAPSTLSMTNRSDTQGPLVTRSNQATTDTRRMSQSHQLQLRNPIRYPGQHRDGTLQLAHINAPPALSPFLTSLELLCVLRQTRPTRRRVFRISPSLAVSNFAPKAAGQSVQALVPEGSPGVAISTSPLPAQPAATELRLRSRYTPHRRAAIRSRKRPRSQRPSRARRRRSNHTLGSPRHCLA